MMEGKGKDRGKGYEKTARSEGGRKIRKGVKVEGRGLRGRTVEKGETGRKEPHWRRI